MDPDRRLKVMRCGRDCVETRCAMPAVMKPAAFSTVSCSQDGQTVPLSNGCRKTRALHQGALAVEKIKRDLPAVVLIAAAFKIIKSARRN